MGSDSGTNPAQYPRSRHPSEMADAGSALRACPACGLIHMLPRTGKYSQSSEALRPAGSRHLPTMRYFCTRCGSRLVAGSSRRARLANDHAAACAFAALILYFPAMVLPVMEVSRFGHIQSATIWSGVVTLGSEGSWGIAMIIFLCSIVLPIIKILLILTLCLWHDILGQRVRLLTHRTLERIGRWSMIDVLLVAFLIAAVKVGQWVNVHAGQGLIAFVGVVIFSMLASALFDPQSAWSGKYEGSAAPHVRISAAPLASPSAESARGTEREVNP